MPAGINHLDSGFTSAYNGTGSTLSPGTRVTLTKTSTAGHGAEFDMTVTGNAALADATVHDEGIADGAVGKVKLRLAPGYHIMIAAGVIAAGSSCTAAASGKVSTGGGTTEGINIDAAAADGDLIRVRVAL